MDSKGREHMVLHSVVDCCAREPPLLPTSGSRTSRTTSDVYLFVHVLPKNDHSLPLSLTRTALPMSLPCLIDGYPFTVAHWRQKEGLWRSFESPWP